jgi:hypothetical protein
MRYQDNDYFYNTLSYTLKEIVKTDKKIVIHLFSQGIEKDFEEFKDFPNVNFVYMNAQDSFLHMVYADCLITSKSSFSYKPALLNKGIKVCPKDFLAWISKHTRLGVNRLKFIEKKYIYYFANNLSDDKIKKDLDFYLKEDAKALGINFKYTSWLTLFNPYNMTLYGSSKDN